jgi:hypothetical protein
VLFEEEEGDKIVNGRVVGLSLAYCFVEILAFGSS